MTIRDVPGVDDDAGDEGVRAQVPHTDLEPAPAAGGVADGHLPGAGRASGSDGYRPGGPRAREMLRGDEAPQGGAEQVGVGAADDRGERRGDGADPGIDVANDGQVRTAVQELRHLGFEQAAGLQQVLAQPDRPGGLSLGVVQRVEVQAHADRGAVGAPEPRDRRPGLAAGQPGKPGGRLATGVGDTQHLVHRLPERPLGRVAEEPGSPVVPETHTAVRVDRDHRAAE